MFTQPDTVMPCGKYAYIAAWQPLSQLCQVPPRCAHSASIAGFHVFAPSSSMKIQPIYRSKLQWEKPHCGRRFTSQSCHEHELVATFRPRPDLPATLSRLGYLSISFGGACG